MELFEIASRQKWRFATSRGELTVENLWDLPLQATGNPSLNSVAVGINSTLKSFADDSFVEPSKASKEQLVLAQKLELVKHIIAVRIAENKARVDAAAKQSEIRKLEEILAQKRETALTNLDEAELEKRLAELRAG